MLNGGDLSAATGAFRLDAGLRPSGSRSRPGDEQ
jgi:hypothetical protein